MNSFFKSIKEKSKELKNTISKKSDKLKTTISEKSDILGDKLKEKMKDGISDVSFCNNQQYNLLSI